MSVFGPSGIAGAPLTEVKPGESWVANTPLLPPLINPPRAEVHETQAPLSLTADEDALIAQAIAEHPWRPDRWVERFARDARAFVGSLS